MQENSLLLNPLFRDRTFFPTNADKTPKVKWKDQALPADQAEAAWSNESHWAMPTGNGLLVVDVDVKHGGKEEDVYALGFPRGTFRVKTPSGGCHLYYKDPGLNLRNSVQKLGDGIDIRTDGGYVCIPPMPGYSITCDHEPKLVFPYDLKFKTQEDNTNHEFVNSGVEEEIMEGSRNTSLFTLGCSLRARGIPTPAIHAAMHAMNKELCNPPLSSLEVDRIIESVFTFESGEMVTQNGPQLRILSASQIQERDGVAKETFLWRNHILDKMPNLLYAEGGMGKTTLSLLVCRDIMEADPEATILWIPAENNLESTRIQMAPLDIDMDRFLILERSSGGYSVDFAKPGDLAELHLLMVQYKPKIVVIDSLGSMSSADINGQPIKDVMKNLQDICCEQGKAGLVYIHHENKGEGTPRNKSMGSNMILAQVRMALRITAGFNGSRVVTAEKFNLTKPEPIQIIAKGRDFEVQETVAAEKDPEEEKEAMEILWNLFTKDKRVYVGKCFSALEEHGVHSQNAQPYIFAFKKKYSLDIVKDKNGKSLYEAKELFEALPSEYD